MGFKVGDAVHWESQANGGHTLKRGVVIGAIPAGGSCTKTHATHLARNWAEDVRFATDFSGLPRKDESYLVLVGGNGKRKPVVYWPRTSALSKS